MDLVTFYLAQIPTFCNSPDLALFLVAELLISLIFSIHFCGERITKQKHVVLAISRVGKTETRPHHCHIYLTSCSCLRTCLGEIPPRVMGPCLGQTLHTLHLRCGSGKLSCVSCCVTAGSHL